MHSEVAIFNVVICNIMELNILGNSITSNGFANLNLTLTMVVCKEKNFFFLLLFHNEIVLTTDPETLL